MEERYENSRFAYFYPNSLVLIRESYALIRESFAFIHESFAIIRESLESCPQTGDNWTDRRTDRETNRQTDSLKQTYPPFVEEGV